MDDTISRQAAIKAICEDGTWLESQGCTEITMAERKQRDADILSDLPSAQPEIIACGQGELVQDGSRLVQDTISRQAAIDAIGNDIMGGLNYRRILLGLPSAQQWIPVTERLPEDGQVVVQYNDGGYDMLRFPTAYRQCDIVAWMPLPEPWKGEQDVNAEP